MNLKGILQYLDNLIEENKDIPAEKFVQIVNELASIVKKQDEILLDIKNSNIRLENRIKYIETELERSKVYKGIVDMMVSRIKKNPISALIYLYKVKKNIDKLSRD